ncbi:MAG TPA: sigma-70 family RNA polymerase sigma factor [Kofleriaceae bacterium]|nr:sigma-70 family RNA polymerase sigma factor [Kofleriaceae bacterium]
MTPDAVPEAVPEAVINELDGLRALARSLVHGDADADDLLQDTAVAALEHPPEHWPDRPVRAWIQAVVRNRWRMDRRGDARRRAREHAVALAAAGPAGASAGASACEALDRARSLERLAAALVALDEPYRTAVIRRYLDGETAAQIARALGVPPGTVRWRLKTGLGRLRAALDHTAPRWQRALILGPSPLALAPLAGATVKTKTSIAFVVMLILLLGVAGIVWRARDHAAPPPAAPAAPRDVAIAPRPSPPRSAAVAMPAIRDPLPGQGRATVEPSDAAGGVIAGRVINWSTGGGVGNADLTFTSDAGASTIRTHDDGGFELAPPAPGRFVLSAIAAPGFLPYAPELLHSTVHVVLAAHQTVRGLTVFLFPALDYHGTVVDAHGAAVAGARVRLLGTPAGEQVIDRPETEWTSDRDGRFTFHAADDAVLEAALGVLRGWARLDGNVAITKQLTIALGDAAARDQTITGRAIDATGAPVADALVRATPADAGPTRSTAFATTGADGGFTLIDLDHLSYNLATEAPDHAPATLEAVPGGTRGVTLTLDAGLPLAGTVVDGDARPAPSYTLLVFRRTGAARDLVVARSIVEPRGQFSVHVPAGDYELVASASGWAPSAPTHAAAGATDVQLTLSTGATLRGTVVASDDGTPIGYARIMREAVGGGASAQPSNAGTVTRADGTFELTGLPAGPVSITIGAGEFHPKIEAGMTASDGATLGPVTIALTRLAAGEQPTIELVGVGIALAADADALVVQRVIAGGGAEAAGIVVGDHVTAVDGAPVAPLGVDGAVAKIRGVAGTTVAITLRRGDQTVQLVVQRRKLKA